jgi:hypothetical protein
MAIETIETIRAPDEHGVQVALFDWLRALPAPGLPGVVADYAWMNPNGLYLGTGSAGKRAGYIAKMKRAGFTPGVADVTIAIPMLGMHGCYLELKRDMTPAAAARAVSEDQGVHLRRMWNNFYFAAVAAGFDQARAAVLAYFRGARDYNLDLFGELKEDGFVGPIQPKRKRSKTKPKA